MTFMDTVAMVQDKHPLVFTLGMMMGLDIATGTIAAIIEKRLSSKVGLAGMMRKAMICLLLGMAAAVERAQPDIPLLKLLSVFFIYVEGISILENAKRAGVPVPAFLSNSLNNLSKNSTEMLPREMHVKVSGVEMDVQTSNSGDGKGKPPLGDKII